MANFSNETIFFFSTFTIKTESSFDKNFFRSFHFPYIHRIKQIESILDDKSNAEDIHILSLAHLLDLFCLSS